MLPAMERRVSRAPILPQWMAITVPMLTKLFTGSVIPLPPGRMRNQFFPRKMAEYMTQAQIKEAGLENVTLERDFTFGIKDAESAKAVEPEVKAAPAKV